MLKVSAFYLEKQKSFIPKKIFFQPQSLNMPREIQKMAFAVLIFSEGFEKSDHPILSFFSNGTGIVCNLGRLAKWHNTIYVMRNFCKNIHSCKYVYFCRSSSFNFRYILFSQRKKSMYNAELKQIAEPVIVTILFIAVKSLFLELILELLKNEPKTL